MLTEAAEFFEKMLNSPFREGIENTVEFPEDDVESWEGLSRWCYTGDLEPLADPNTRSTSQKANPVDCWIRLKLCCLAEKYDMKLLQNFAIDSIIVYLRGSGEGPTINFDMFSAWTKYVYDNTHEMSALRKFISSYFYYALMYSKPCPVARDQELSSIQYGVDELYSLAENNHDLQRQIFSHVRHFSPLAQHTSTDLGPEPWFASPCKFHNHTNPSIECPESLHRFVHRWPDNSARVQYFVQDRTLKGADILYVQQVATELGIKLRDAVLGIAGLVRTEMIAWVVPEISFRVAPPRPS
ncbi:hypothetical protein BDZ45DRAFT_439356 [Acephala macrosclerotiorum]|nr:hypothetical protein BDZ45DRAFT_439356 [Acephala macrosclerotiorum]